MKNTTQEGEKVQTATAPAREEVITENVEEYFMLAILAPVGWLTPELNSR